MLRSNRPCDNRFWDFFINSTISVIEISGWPPNPTGDHTQDKFFDNFNLFDHLTLLEAELLRDAARFHSVMISHFAAISFSSSSDRASDGDCFI